MTEGDRRLFYGCGSLHNSSLKQPDEFRLNLAVTAVAYFSLLSVDFSNECM